MTNQLVCASAWRIAGVLGLGLFACTMDNPAFDQTRDELGSTVGDGDEDSTVGDGDGEPTSGDGDGEPTSGDGDGEPTSGDGDGDDEAESTTDEGDGDGDGEPTDCGNTGEELCDGSCVDTNFDNSNCGLCGQACGDTQICGQGNCLHKKYVFVTTEVLPGHFGGPGVADSLCNELASAADLPGSYMPWLSTPNSFPAQVVAPILAAYVLRDGPVIAWSWPEFISNQHRAAINHNQWGSAIAPTPACGLEYAVWTGTSDTGQPLSSNCSSWTDANDIGVVGNAQTGGPGWSDSDCEIGCNTKLPIYCVQK